MTISISVINGLGARSLSLSFAGQVNTTSAAACIHSSVRRRSSAAEASALACGMPAFFCAAIGMKGLGRAASGQASSVSPLTHRQSKRSPADSSTPSTWIGASGDSGWKSAAAQWRSRNE